MCWARFYSENTSTRAQRKTKKKKSTGLPRQPEQSAAFSMSSQLLPHVCVPMSTVPPCRGSTVQMLRLHHHTWVLIVALSRGLQNLLLSSPRWHACAKLVDTHFAWWQPTHPRTSYHKLEGLSPGWVREWRCIFVCGVKFFFSGSARLPDAASGTARNERLWLWNNAWGCYRGKQEILA